MDKYIIDHKNSQVTLRKKSQNITNSERMKDEVNIYYQTTMNNEKSENLSGNSFNFKIKNDSKNILNVLNLLDGENDTINICKVLNLSFEEVDKILRTLLEGEVIEILG